MDSKGISERDQERDQKGNPTGRKELLTMKIKNEKDNFRLSVLEILSSNSDDLEGIKRQLVRSLIRGKKKKEMCIPESFYKPLIVHFDTLVRELYIEDSTPFLERLNASEKVYIEEIYTFIIEHFHELHEDVTVWKILLILEQCGSGRG